MSEEAKVTESGQQAQATQAASAGRKDRGNRKTRVGEVVSAKMNKTVVVKTTKQVPHPKFRKIVKQIRRFHVHDEKGEAKQGDRVVIAETRPMSRLKRWRLVEILKK